MRCASQPATAPVADWIERAAAGASFLCLIHCIGLPLLLAALPGLSKLVALPESFHLWMLAFALPASSIALFGGYAGHLRMFPLLIGIGGLVLLAAAALLWPGEMLDTLATIAGALCLMFAHLSNWRLRHRNHRHG